jgi:hypothetical protein
MELVMQLDLAPVITALPGRIQFKVDEVTPASEPLPVSSLRTVLERVLGGRLLASNYGEDIELVDRPLKLVGPSTQLHPLVAAIHYAFSDHRPLILGPDAFWLTIGQGFAQHVNLHHEALRDRLVRHEGKRQLVVSRDHLLSAEDWTELVEGWTAQVAAEAGHGLARLVSCDFSTTTPAARTASQIVLMDAFQRYFDYREMTICGIPTITLGGTPDDWRRIRERIEVLAEYGLEWWVARLRPICDALVRTAEGQPARRFWQEIYKPEGAYGGDVATGWVADLFPYINDGVSHTPTRQNPILRRPRAEITARDGLPLNCFPSGLSEVTCHLQGPEGNAIARLVGGLVGVRQHLRGDLSPVPGWVVGGVNQFTELLQRLAVHGQQAAPIGWQQHRRMVELPKEALQLLDAFHGKTLFSGSGHGWRVREVEALDSYEVVEPNRWISALLDLDDGRVVGTRWHSTFSGSIADGMYRRHEELWVVVGRPRADTRERFRSERPVLHVAETMVIARSFEAFVESLLATEGAYYFDAPDFTPEAVFESR